MLGVLDGGMGCSLKSMDIGSKNNPLESGKLSLVSGEENYGCFGDGQRFSVVSGEHFCHCFGTPRELGVCKECLVIHSEDKSVVKPVGSINNLLSGGEKNYVFS